MASLTPEQRMDKNGHIVTRHVRNSPLTSTGKSIPAPALTASEKASPTPKTKQNHHKNIRVRSSDNGMKEWWKRNHRVYDILRFDCSDAEAYEVFSTVAKPEDAFRLLSAGVKSKQTALDFLRDNEIEEIGADNDELVAELIRRNLPAIPAMEAVNTYGKSMQERWPDYYDAVEAQSMRTLREQTNIPHLVLVGEVNMADVRIVGATRIAAAENKFISVTEQLELINKGKSDYDAETLKKLIMKSEESGYTSVPSPLMMADSLGADFVIGLEDFAAASTLYGGLTRSKYDSKKFSEIMKLNDDVLSKKHRLRTEDLSAAYDAGLSANELDDGFKSGMTIDQIIAVKQGIETSLSSGWL